MAFDFDAQVGWGIGSTLRNFQNFDRVHRFGRHPLNAPPTGMDRLIHAGIIANAAVGALIEDVG